MRSRQPNTAFDIAQRQPQTLSLPRSPASHQRARRIRQPDGFPRRRTRRRWTKRLPARTRRLPVFLRSFPDLSGVVTEVLGDENGAPVYLRTKERERALAFAGKELADRYVAAIGAPEGLGAPIGRWRNVSAAPETLTE